VAAKEQPAPRTRPDSEARKASEHAYKARQAEYRKEQYQKQKRRLKGEKSVGKPKKAALTAFPVEVQTAIDYFEKNGFPIAEPFRAESVNAAKKKLSRIFHPDIGGSHEEIVQLNENCRVMLAYIAEQA
jgi:hypothetical protein